MSDISEAMGGEAFDTNSVPPAEAFEPLPAGWYPVLIEGAEVKATKKGDGKLLALELTVVGDNLAGRKLWPRINLQNPSTKAVEIGMRALAGLGQACGLASISDSGELIGKTICVRVKVRAETGREPDNEVVAYKPYGAEEKPAATAPAAETKQAAAAPAKVEPKPAAAPAAAAAPKSKRPWER